MIQRLLQLVIVRAAEFNRLGITRGLISTIALLRLLRGGLLLFVITAFARRLTARKMSIEIRFADSQPVHNGTISSFFHPKSGLMPLAEWIGPWG